jgi:hypothetical protein
VKLGEVIEKVKILSKSPQHRWAIALNHQIQNPIARAVLRGEYWGYEGMGRLIMKKWFITAIKNYLQIGSGAIIPETQEFIC